MSKMCRQKLAVMELFHLANMLNNSDDALLYLQDGDIKASVTQKQIDVVTESPPFD